jgi:uncharacterized membrane protein (TIGR02234 family)
MADTDQRHSRFSVRLAQLSLVVAAGALWAASRLAWVVIRSFDGLGQPKQAVVSGASWSTALLPLALLSLAAAIAPVAVRGWPLRVLAVLMAAASLAAGYLAISFWVVRDMAVTLRAADIADVPVVALLGTERHYAGAAVTLTAALCMLAGAALLLRSTARRDNDGPAGPETPEMSERMIWDALDEGSDPTDARTDRSPGPDAEGR